MPCFSAQEVAEQLIRSRYFVYEEIKARRLAHYRIGGQICVSQADLDAYVARSRVAANGERKVKQLTALEAAQ